MRHQCGGADASDFERPVAGRRDGLPRRALPAIGRGVHRRRSGHRLCRRHHGRHRPGAKGNRMMMNAVPISWFLTLSAILFALGVAGFLFRRNIITVFMSIELMLNAVNLSFVTFSYQHKEVSGHLFTFFVMVVAAAEAAVGLAIILTVFKGQSTLNIDDVNSMKN